MRVSVHRADEPLAPVPVQIGERRVVRAVLALAPPSDGVTRVESPMVGVFYRAPNPRAPAFVDVGHRRPGPGALHPRGDEAVQQLKAETAGVVSTIHAENARPVGSALLFELEPVPSTPVV